MNLTETDNLSSLVAVADWYYTTLRRAGREKEAAELLEMVATDEAKAAGASNHSDLQRILVYKGDQTPDTLLDGVDTNDVDFVNLGYGLGNYFFYNGEEDRAHEIWNDVLDGGYWSALEYLATEVEMERTHS